MSKHSLVPTAKLNDGSEIPVIAFGTGSKLKNQDVVAFVTNALEAGFTHIDTAAIYKNEQYVGTALREVGLSRSELYITTKYDGGDVQEGVRTSLSKLNVTFVDLYLIHDTFIVPNGDIEHTWSQFESIQKEGLVKSIGVSNFSAADLERIVRSGHVLPSVNQIRLHPYIWTFYKDLLEYSAKHNIVIEAYGSLAPITQFPGGVLDPVLDKLAKRIGGTSAQVIFKWVLAKGAVVVTTSTRRERLEEYLATPSLPDLTPEEVAEIDAAGAKGPPTQLHRISTQLLHSLAKTSGARVTGAHRLALAGLLSIFIVGGLFFCRTASFAAMF